VCRISLRRGLFEANTTRFPTSFSTEGIRSAWGRTQLCFGREMGFDLKKFIVVGRIAWRAMRLQEAAQSSDALLHSVDPITDSGFSAPAHRFLPAIHREHDQTGILSDDSSDIVSQWSALRLPSAQGK
jgi:hypothetical protein